MTSHASRVSTTSMGTRRVPEIKPSDVYELKLKTQQLVLKARRLRTQQQRLLQRIQASTNAINKTFEQQSDEPSVVTNHTNTIPQLRRSVQVAENTLSKLRDDVQNTHDSDKTFVVKEQQEEVKIAYCEHQRLVMELQDAKIQGNYTSEDLAEAQRRGSSQNISELRQDIRMFQEKNASLRDKAVAYHTKREKLLLEQQIKEHEKNKVPADRTVNECAQKRQEMDETIGTLFEQIEADKEGHKGKIEELRAIIEEQKEKIAATLDGKIIPPKEPAPEEEEGGEADTAEQ